MWISACHPFFPTALAKVVGQTGKVVLFEFFRANGCCFRTLEGSSKLFLHLSPSPLQLLDLSSSLLRLSGANGCCCRKGSVAGSLNCSLDLPTSLLLWLKLWESSTCLTYTPPLCKNHQSCLVFIMIFGEVCDFYRVILLTCIFYPRPLREDYMNSALTRRHLCSVSQMSELQPLIRLHTGTWSALCPSAASRPMVEAESAWRTK